MRSLEIRRLRKEYPGTVALEDVSLRFEGGKIHALVGKNGAGKSTLVKILAGAVRPSSGELLVDGGPVTLNSPREALRYGIAAVHQELSLVPELTVAENILLGRLPGRKGSGGILIDWEKTFASAQRILDRLELSLDVRKTAGSLGVAQQQVVEIAKAMSYEPAVLMLDEPTSALAQHETDHLFTLLRTLASQGVVLLYVTHRLQELPRIADSVTVLRDGRLVGTVTDASPSNLVRMMFGEVIQQVRPADLVAARETVMQVRNLSRSGAFEQVSFTLHRGEILGIAGLLGSGRTELLRALFGADRADTGEVEIGGTVVRPASPGQMKRLGVALAPEKRKEEGLVQILSTRTNMCLASLEKVARRGIVTRSRELDVVRRRIEEASIKVSDPEAAVSSLSGGNQQKVVLGKWLATEPAVMLLDEPTRGIDVRAKQQIFQIMWDLSRKGIASLVVSSELEELLDVCHRILVMNKGRITAEVDPANARLDSLFAACME
jgi:ribose transport system ATP-binding protein